MLLKSFVAVLGATVPLVALAADDSFRLTLTAASEFDAGTGLCGINVRLDRASAAELYRFSTDHTGETVDLMVDGQVIQTPQIMMPMAAGTLQIIATKTDPADCGALATALADGSSALELRFSGR